MGVMLKGPFGGHPFSGDSRPPPLRWVASNQSSKTDLAVGQNQWYHFGVGAPPILEPTLVGIGMFTGGTGF